MTGLQTGDIKTFDALVIGSGLAGVFFCFELLKKKPDINIALITKGQMIDSNSQYAQGGIAASQSQDIKQHIEDTLKAGDGLCFDKNVEEIIQHSDEAIQALIELGVPFDTNGKGYALAKEGGHSARRIYHVGDETGKSTMQTLLKKAEIKKQITFFTHHTTVNLIKQTPNHGVGQFDEVKGAYILDEKDNQIHAFLANITVLATGGAGKIFRYTTNPDVATGDGVAMAYRAGARIGNMEFFQFHPTLLHHPTLNNFLVSEAVRGEGAKLLNGDSLKRFMVDYAPHEMELATRDIVARAIFTEIEKSEADFVYLDITHHSREFLSSHFPAIFKTLLAIGLDMSQDKIPVVPAAHYQCGGILSKPNGETDLRRLYAIGEVAFTGLHGANRLASNSLLEAMVMAKLAANNALTLLETPLSATNTISPWHSKSTINDRRASQINAHWRGLRGEMTSYAGIVRTEAGLEDLLTLIKCRKQIIEEYYWSHQITRDFVELRNIILVAELIVRSALNRRESRGGHFREDFPHKSLTSIESILSRNTFQPL
jgi:L-aspartate oxidase